MRTLVVAEPQVARRLRNAPNFTRCFYAALTSRPQTVCYNLQCVSPPRIGLRAGNTRQPEVDPFVKNLG